ncbi:heme biosynthesis protein HemY [Roseobacter sp. HKCCA0434]|uniref:heme biosynthesis protein HemY n=1 Tax=Roseobacter sp. HKCCA0434 TaxID=3079297 RepID=UPI002905B6BC|nr:heme biosynthesis HemY N-terminal domain-containing protein [Roseobacter sp. HKCCA0434]
MLWPLIKIVLFVALVTAAAFGVMWVMEQDGGLTVAIGGREYPFSPVEVLVFVLIALVVLAILLKLAGFLVALMRFFAGDETAVSRYFDRNRERRGFNALGEAMMLNASGDGKAALARARSADKKLARPELTRLVTAQAAELAGERAVAEEEYKAMLTDPRTRFVGIHGLMRQRLAMGETETALKLAEKAFALRPKHEALLGTLFTLQTEQDHWRGARRTLAAQVKAGTLPRDVANRRDAMLNLALARTAIAEENYGEEADAALEAHRLSPDHVAASVAASRVHLHRESPRAAQRVLLKTWKLNPHPDLAAAYAAIEPEESAAARRKRFEPLVKANPDHPETKMLVAEMAVAEEDFPAARRAMGTLATDQPTTRALALMAAIERGEGAEDRVVRAWLARALTAPVGPQWVCTNCRTIHSEWSAVCSNCDAFDTISWIELPQGAPARAESAAMLPVITGMFGRDQEPEADPEAEPDDTPAPDEVVDPTPAEPVEAPTAPREPKADIDEIAHDVTDTAAGRTAKKSG